MKANEKTEAKHLTLEMGRHTSLAKQTVKLAGELGFPSPQALMVRALEVYIKRYIPNRVKKGWR